MNQHRIYYIVITALCISLINLGCIKEMPTFTEYVPYTPKLLFPSNGAINVSSSPRIKWYDTPGAMQYFAEIGEDSTFESHVITNGNLTSPTWNITKLKYGTVYYWHVNASNSSGTSVFSQTFWFLTATEDSTFTP